MEQEETTLNVTPRQAGIRYGLIAAVISIAWFLVMSLADFDLQGPAGYFGWVLTVILIVLAHKYYKENGDGYMSFGQGVSIAFWLGLISASIGSVFTYIYVRFVDTGFIEALKDKQIEALEGKGMSDEQIEQAMKIGSMFLSPESMFFMGLIGGIIGAVIFGLIVSIFTQKASPETAI
jgi:hypothetical protein